MALDGGQAGFLALIPGGFRVRGEDEVVKAFRFDGAGFGVPSAVAKHKNDIGFANSVGPRITSGALLHTVQSGLVDVHRGDVISLAKQLTEVFGRQAGETDGEARLQANGLAKGILKERN
jgi:hypothetical protein